jgi:hypothetical protein
MNPLHFLTLLLIALKLTETIDWSWWVVFAPSLAVFILWVALIYTLVRAELGGPK